jgi:hypothetical protein
MTALHGLAVYTPPVTFVVNQTAATMATTAMRIRHQRIRTSGGICVT